MVNTIVKIALTILCGFLIFIVIERPSIKEIGSFILHIVNINSQAETKSTSKNVNNEEYKSLVMEYKTRSVLSAVSPDSRIIDGKASTEEIRAGIAALIAKDIELVDLVKSLFADKHLWLRDYSNTALVYEVLQKIILPEIESKEKLARSGGFMTTSSNKTMMVGGTYYKEWARGMVGYGVKDDINPLAKWPDIVYLVRSGGNKINLKDNNGDLIVPGMKYIKFNLIPLTVANIVTSLISGQSPDVLLRDLEETTGVKKFGLDDSWKQWWKEHAAKDFKIREP